MLRSARTAPEARRYPHDLQLAALGESAPSGDTEGKVECIRVDTRKLAQEKPCRKNATAAILIGGAQSYLNHPLGYRYLVHSVLRAGCARRSFGGSAPVDLGGLPIARHFDNMFVRFIEQAPVDSNTSTPDLVDNHVHCAGASSPYRFV
jgi:hypothetical protein